jgi:hypothetical protein
MRCQMRLLMAIPLSLLVAMLAAACASTPPPAASTVSKQDEPAVVQASKLTSNDLLAMQARGYKLVTKDGETLFCSNDLKTGSHLVHETSCLTERQAINLREDTQRRLQMGSTPVPPKSGT